MNQTRRKNPPCLPGDMLLIPYGEGTIYGRVVYYDAPDAPKAQLRGLYMTVLDREAGGEADLAEVAAAQPRLKPDIRATILKVVRASVKGGGR